MASSTLGNQLPEAPCALRLRGLPFTTTEQDIFAFFAKHDVVEMIAEVNKAVKMIMKPNGKASGQAIVVMKSKQEADITQAALHGQWMGSRYIEVFPNNDLAGLDGEMTTGDFGAAAAAPSNAGPPAFQNMEAASLPDGIGDTGGSGSMPPSVWPLNQAAPSEEALLAARRAALEAGAGTGGEGVAMEHGDTSWAALFDFLKRDSAAGQAPAETPTEGIPSNVQVQAL
jgi:RNA recognition motif-containing protein